MKKKGSSASPTMHMNPPSVSIEKVGKGFVMSSYSEKGHRKAIATDDKSMLKAVKSMLRGK